MRLTLVRPLGGRPPWPAQHWLFASLFCGGFGLRVLAVVSYRPALFYIDTVRYLYDSGGNDPVGYRLPLKAILAAGNFDLVAIAQHLLGLAMAATIYVVLVRACAAGGSGGSSPRGGTVRAGTARWLAAIAAAPVLLDAYQIQIEQMILPDVWFEALIVAGIAALLGARAGLRALVIAGLAFGISATFRQVGEILIIPALVYLIAAGGGPRTVTARCAVLTAAFVVPILGYMTGSYVLVGHFYLSHSGVTTTYGRMAWSADCATLRLPAVERALCPTPAQRAHGPDWLEHGQAAPIRAYYTGPLSGRASALVAGFSKAVLGQQPGRVLGSYAGDLVKLFALGKVTSPGDTPVARWQFQASYPYLSPHATPAQVGPAITRYGGGKPAVWRPGAVFLRRYQLGGGYTPGPVLAFCVALAGAGMTVRRRDQLAQRWLAQCSLLFFGCGAALLLMSDVFEFSWRYQLPALVTLPPAAAAAVAGIVRLRGTGRPARTEELAQAGEQVRLRD